MKTIVAIAITVALAATAGGFMLDAKGFGGNLLAEIVGILMAAVLAVLIIDRAVERDRARRWDLVSQQTLSTLRFVVLRAGMDVYLSLPAPRPPNADPYTLGQLGEEGGLTDALKELSGVVRTADGIGVDDELVIVLKGHLEVVRGGVLPQLLAIGTHDLIARLSTVEAAFQDLEQTAWLEQRFTGLNQFHSELAGFIDALAGVSEQIDLTN